MKATSQQLKLASLGRDSISRTKDGAELERRGVGKRVVEIVSGDKVGGIVCLVMVVRTF